MSWYDIKSNVKAPQELSVGGNAMAAFGDAFSDIGKSFADDELHKEKIKSQQLDASVKQMQLDNAYGETTQKAIDDAYLANLDNNGKFDDKNGTIGVPIEQVSFEAKQKADVLAQKNFNDAAVKTAFGSKSYEDFKTKNPDLIEKADGITLEKIKTSFDNSKAQIQALKQQQTLNNMNTKLNKAELKALQEKNKNGFKYTQDTGTKIVSLAKTALGMDKDNFEIDENKQKEFSNMVTEISTLSKEYNLEPNQAYKLWLDSKEKAQPTTESVKKSWRDFK